MTIEEQGHIAFELEELVEEPSIAELIGTKARQGATTAE